MKNRVALLLVLILLALAPGALAKGRPGGFSGGFQMGEIEASEPMTEEERMEYLLEEAKQDRLDKMRREYVPKEKDYDQNTVCSFGPQFRDISPRMTDLWYMFTPVDLSVDGTQTFDLIAGNMFVIGQVSVTVENGRFQVDYAYNSTQIEIGREYFNIFPDYDSIEEENLENLHAQKRFSYGKSYSIADKLEGDTDVILFVCNTATFKKTTRGVGEYYKNHPDRVPVREAMLEMIGKQITTAEN